MFIEDLLNQLYNNCSIKLNNFDRSVIQSLVTQSYTQKNFTEKQGNLAIKLISKYKSQLEHALAQNIDNFIKNPQFKMPFRMINNQKTMKIIDHSMYIKAIKVEFPYHETLLNKLRTLRQGNYVVSRFSYYDSLEKSWIFGLNETNIQLLTSILDEFGFVCDPELKKYMDDIFKIEKSIEQHLPMLTKQNEEYAIVNLPHYVSTKKTDDLIDALFWARELGVTVWDNQIEDLLLEKEGNSFLIKFLKTDPGQQFEFDLLNNDLLSLGHIIKYLFPCVVIIPGGTELEKLTQALQLFKDLQVDNKEISVLFRLNNSTNAEFNQFVRENHYNNPLTDKTKVVFLSQHIPKTILSPIKKFNSLLNFNYMHVHHKLAIFIKNQENVINILEKTRQRRLNFGNL